VLGELGRRLGAVCGKRGYEIGDRPNLREGDGLDLGVVAGEPPGRRALVAALVLAQDQAQAERVLEGDVLELSGRVQDQDGIPCLEGALELGVCMPWDVTAIENAFAGWRPWVNPAPGYT
jgi:hypothetical protein